jgi:ESX secretion system ATPase EccB
MVTSDGSAYLIGGKLWRLMTDDQMQDIERAVFGDGKQPQKVSAAFVKTLNPVGTLDFPTLQDLGAQAGSEAHIEGLLPQYSKVGLVLEAPSGSSTQKFIVLKDGVKAVSDFTAQMWLRNPFISAVYAATDPEPVKVSFNDIQPETGEWLKEKNWPAESVKQANTVWELGGEKTSCSIWHGGEKNPRTGRPLMSVWTGQDFPKDVSQSGSRTYVSPGSGLLFKRITGTDAGGGSTFLVTDTGLRYSIPARNDSEVTGGEKADNQTQQTNTSQVRLGYGKIRAASVPATWADLLAAGPELSSGNAEQAQGS